MCEGRRSAVTAALSLLSVRFGAMTTCLFLPTNRKLILELASYIGLSPGIFSKTVVKSR
jgi:hypothetical protein